VKKPREKNQLGLAHPHKTLRTIPNTFAILANVAPASKRRTMPSLNRAENIRVARSEMASPHEAMSLN
jgi:hypothetical protein